jgi:hypothetical protein
MPALMAPYNARFVRDIGLHGDRVADVTGHTLGRRPVDISDNKRRSGHNYRSIDQVA